MWRSRRIERYPQHKLWYFSSQSLGNKSLQVDRRWPKSVLDFDAHLGSSPPPISIQLPGTEFLWDGEDSIAKGAANQGLPIRSRPNPKEWRWWWECHQWCWRMEKGGEGVSTLWVFPSSGNGSRLITRLIMTRAVYNRIRNCINYCTNITTQK